jgi:hypothetical protein
VLRALAKDPAQRYADADELIAALEQERERLPALSGAPGAGGPHGQPPTPSRAATPAPGSLLLRATGDRRRTSS